MSNASGPAPAAESFAPQRVTHESERCNTATVGPPGPCRVPSCPPTHQDHGRSCRYEGIVPTANDGTDRTQVFRTRAVIVAGLVDILFGSAMLFIGVGLAAVRGSRDALPFGLALSVVALITLLTGLGRMTARMELSETSVAWTWTFSRFEVALSDLADAELVEKGSPASGASWAGFLGGGLIVAAAWWIVELAAAFVRSGPSLGPLELVVIKRHGGAAEVRPISAWSTHASRSQANAALHAVRTAIAASARRRPPGPPPPSMIRHDAWDPPAEGWDASKGA